jgi:hypothetical protein
MFKKEIFLSTAGKTAIEKAFSPSSLLVFILSARQVKALSILASKQWSEDVEKILITAKYLHFVLSSIVRIDVAPNYNVKWLVLL